MRALLKRDPRLRKVVTYTTRPPREGEVEGFDYRFVNSQTFQRLVADGTVYEYEKVYQDYFYGSPRELFVDGKDGIIELDYKGRMKYQLRHRAVVSVFLLPPNLHELRRRIVSRSEVSNLEARLANAVEQIRRARTYDYVVKNEDFETCVARVQKIVEVERLRRRGTADLADIEREIADLDLGSREAQDE